MSVEVENETPANVQALLRGLDFCREHQLKFTAFVVKENRGGFDVEITVDSYQMARFLGGIYAKTGCYATYHPDGNGNTWAVINVDGCVVKALD